MLSAVDGLLRAVAACRFQFKTNYWDVSEAEEQARILRQTAEQWEAMQAEVGAEGQETEAAGTPMIVVQANYRLGGLGFMAWEPLTKEAECQ